MQISLPFTPVTLSTVHRVHRPRLISTARLPTRDARNPAARRQACGPLWSDHVRRLQPSIAVCDGLAPAQIGSCCDAPSSPVALVTRAATPLSTPQLGRFIGCRRGDLFLHWGPVIEFSRGHCGECGKRALPDHRQALRSNDRWSIFRFKRSSRSICLSTRRMPCIHARYQLGVAAY
jgi:hypothetical protein